ncbi:TlpA family protein disulfide reductase [Halosquirtibacter xylanolyticus]|uniref:TlpA family protein disulfide reductase n=1 Tax=Halosquirtibacter xylanolyticus TaxID=3374599 RepID=UPI003748C4E8|nr:TlpA family protein disulfide reductase [Prolixibacteraceae bacterium]
MMKTLQQITLLFAILMLASCDKTPPKDCALLTIKTEDSSLKEIRARIGRKVKVLKRDSNGEFCDTIHFKKQNSDQVLLFANKTIRFVYIEKNKSVVMNVTGDNLSLATFDKDLAKENNLFTEVDKELNQYKDKVEMIETIEEAKEEVDKFVKEYESKGTLISKDPIYKRVVKMTVGNNAAITILFPVQDRIRHQRLTVGDLSKGKPAPKFVNYENYSGGKISMEDLKGKYLLVEISSSNCGACRKQVAPLKEIEKRYKDKNITYVNIDLAQKRHHDRWMKRVKKEKLSGVHLFANGDDELMKAYATNSFPTFILIDPQGNIVTANAPKPTNPKLIELLDPLL